MLWTAGSESGSLHYYTRIRLHYATTTTATATTTTTTGLRSISRTRTANHTCENEQNRRQSRESGKNVPIPILTLLLHRPPHPPLRHNNHRHGRRGTQRRPLRRDPLPLLAPQNPNHRQSPQLLGRRKRVLHGRSLPHTTRRPQRPPPTRLQRRLFPTRKNRPAALHGGAVSRRLIARDGGAMRCDAQQNFGRGELGDGAVVEGGGRGGVGVEFSETGV